MLAWTIFKGLLSFFDSFISRKYKEIAQDINNINISKFIADLIFEESRMNSNLNLETNKAYKTKSFNSKNKQPFCKYYKLKKHLKKKYWKKYSELRNNNNLNIKDASKDTSKAKSYKDKQN